MKRFFLFILFALLGISTWAQSDESYTMTLAREAYNDGDFEKASEYVAEELKTNPHSPAANFMAASILWSTDEYEGAAHFFDNTIGLTRDKEILFACYLYGGKSYFMTDDYDRALKYLDKALKLSEDDEERLDVYTESARVYFAKTDLQKCEKMLRKAEKISSEEPMVLSLRAKLCFVKKQYRECVDYATKAIAHGDGGSNYCIRSVASDQLGEYSRSAADLIECAMLTGDDYSDVLDYGEHHYAEVRSQLILKQKREPGNCLWPYLLGYLYQNVGNYADALESFKDAYDNEQDAATANRISSTLFNMGDLEGALKWNARALQHDSTSFYALYRRLVCLVYGSLDTAALGALTTPEACLKNMAENDPFSTSSAVYSVGAWYYQYVKEYDKAIEESHLAIAANPEDLSNYYYRARSYAACGKDKEAKKDYEYVLSHDTAAMPASYIPFVYLGLGRTDEAIAKNLLLLKAQPDDVAVLYNSACLYALMGRYDEALDYLQQALDKGYAKLFYIEGDPDLAALRNLDRYKQMMYRARRHYAQQVLPPLKADSME